MQMQVLTTSVESLRDLLLAVAGGVLFLDCSHDYQL